MEERKTPCRGLGALAGLLARARDAGDGASTGLRVLVDLDEGTVSAVRWTDGNFEDEGQSWQGPGISEALLEALAPLTGLDRTALQSVLLDENAMKAFGDALCDTLQDYPDDAEVPFAGHSLRLLPLIDTLESLDDAVRDLTEQLCVYHPDREGPAASVILYGACAGFKPLQIKFRRFFHGVERDAFLLWAGFEDPTFLFLPDDGALADAGLEQLRTGGVLIGVPTVPEDLVLFLTDASGADKPFPLAARGQTAKQLRAQSPPFFITENSPLRIRLGDRDRELWLPPAFSGSDGAVVVAAAALDERSLILSLTDTAAADKRYSFTIDGR